MPGTTNMQEAERMRRAWWSASVRERQVAGVRDPYAEREKYLKMLNENPSDEKAKRLFEFWDKKVETWEKLHNRKNKSPQMPPAWS